MTCNAYATWQPFNLPQPFSSMFTFLQIVCLVNSTCHLLYTTTYLPQGRVGKDLVVCQCSLQVVRPFDFFLTWLAGDHGDLRSVSGTCRGSLSAIAKKFRVSVWKLKASVTWHETSRTFWRHFRQDFSCLEPKFQGEILNAKPKFSGWNHGLLEKPMQHTAATALKDPSDKVSSFVGQLEQVKLVTCRSTSDGSRNDCVPTPSTASDVMQPNSKATTCRLGRHSAPEIVKVAQFSIGGDDCGNASATSSMIPSATSPPSACFFEPGLADSS